MPLLSGTDILADVMERNEFLFANACPVPEVNEISSTLADCLESSALCVFETMCGIQLTREKAATCGSRQRLDVSGIITLSGQVQATIALRFPTELVFACAETLLGKRPVEFDGDFIDVVGELANMVVGGAKERYPRKGITLGLPFVVSGREHKVSFPMGVSLLALQFRSNRGVCVAEIGLKQPSPC